MVPLRRRVKMRLDSVRLQVSETEAEPDTSYNHKYI